MHAWLLGRLNRRSNWSMLSLAEPSLAHARYASLLQPFMSETTHVPRWTPPRASSDKSQDRVPSQDEKLNAGKPWEIRWVGREDCRGKPWETQHTRRPSPTASSTTVVQNPIFLSAVPFTMATPSLCLLIPCRWRTWRACCAIQEPIRSERLTFF
jgi:hypothetical protein